MKKLAAIILLLAGCEGNTEIDKILAAKDIVRSRVNYPDTLDFHEMKTNVSGNTVSLTFTCKNAFGVPETRTTNIQIP